MPRILCIDYGERHTGVAVSDETKTIAQGLPTIHHRSIHEQIDAVKRLIARHDVDEIVVGLPMGRSGKPSSRSRQVSGFVDMLAEMTALPVRTFDERFSTVRANEVLEEAYGRSDTRSRNRPPATGTAQKRRAAADKIAATIILEDYLASRR